ncbi:MAG: class I SAM-dependent methyltransferase, partial [Planctomycetaceae bacterium]|nr:class I SAM-dependent methyltransferase [Planctomycetaceae bacterium]
MSSRIPVAGVLAGLLFLTSPLLAADAKQRAEEILKETGVQGGFVVHVGCGNGELTAALKASDAFQVHGLDRNAKNVEAARASIQSAGPYGDVAADQWTTANLPYVDNLVNLLVVEQESKLSESEMLRVLVPNGVAYVEDANGNWEKTVKPWPEEIDEWSHYLHDASGNSVAHDDAVGPPRHLQWVGSPRWSRHHDRMASMSALVSTNGRMFYIMDE